MTTEAFSLDKYIMHHVQNSNEWHLPFLPPIPLRVIVDHQGEDAGNSEMRDLQPGDAHALLEQPELREELLPELLKRTQTIASGRIAEIIAQARKEMSEQLDHEISRLEDLQKVNRAVRTEEIELLAEQRRALDEHLLGARLRLDGVRLIQRGPKMGS